MAGMLEPISCFISDPIILPEPDPDFDSSNLWPDLLISDLSEIPANGIFDENWVASFLICPDF